MILVLAPGGDYAADRVADWAGAAFNGKQHTIQKGSEIDVAQVRVATKNGSAFVFYFGHGRYDAWIECRAKELERPEVVRRILGISDAGALAPAVILAVACKSAKKLGVASKRAGVSRFIGFAESIYWYPSSDRGERALASAIRDLVGVTLSRASQVKRSDLIPLLKNRETYFQGMASRGDVEAGWIAGIFKHLCSVLVVH